MTPVLWSAADLMLGAPSYWIRRCCGCFSTRARQTPAAGATWARAAIAPSRVGITPEPLHPAVALETLDNDAMVAGLIVHARARQAAARRDEAVDAPPRPFAPADVERREFRKELQLAIGEMVVDPPAIARQSAPSAYRSANHGTTTEAIAPMQPSASRRSQMWRP